MQRNPQTWEVLSPDRSPNGYIATGIARIRKARIREPENPVENTKCRTRPMKLSGHFRYTRMLFVGISKIAMIPSTATEKKQKANSMK